MSPAVLKTLAFNFCNNNLAAVTLLWDKLKRLTHRPGRAGCTAACHLWEPISIPTSQKDRWNLQTWTTGFNDTQNHFECDILRRQRCIRQWTAEWYMTDCTILSESCWMRPKIRPSDCIPYSCLGLNFPDKANFPTMDNWRQVEQICSWRVGPQTPFHIDYHKHWHAFFDYTHSP